jgi:Sugar kinases, ribokinase family
VSVEVYSVGEILVDMIFVERVGEGARIEVHFGGAPANLAVGVSRLAHRAGFIGAVGNDPFGEFLVKTLQVNGVDTDLVRVKKARTTLAIVIVDERGERKFFFYRKPWAETADTMLTPSDIALEKLKGSKVVHFSGFSTSYAPTSETVFSIAEYASSEGITVSYDPTYREDIWLSVEDALRAYERSLSYANVVSLSMDEAEAIYGTSDYRRVAEKILAKHPNVSTVAVRLGGRGAYVRTREGREAFKEAFRVKVVDTTGAGDAWTAAFLVSHVLEGMDLEDSVTFANAVAAIVCTRYGAIAALPSRDEVEQFLEAAKRDQ